MTWPAWATARKRGEGEGEGEREGERGRERNGTGPAWDANTGPKAALPPFMFLTPKTRLRTFGPDADRISEIGFAAIKQLLPLKGLKEAFVVNDHIISFNLLQI